MSYRRLATVLILWQLIWLSIACAPVHKGVVVRGELSFDGATPDVDCELRLYKKGASRPYDTRPLKYHISTSFVVGGRTVKQFFVVVNCDGRDVYTSDVFSTEKASTVVELDTVKVGS